MDRYTADVDLVTDRTEGVKAAAGAVEDALRAAGFEAERQNRDSGLDEVFYGFEAGLIEWIVASPDGQRTVLQIAHFDRNRAPAARTGAPGINDATTPGAQAPGSPLSRGACQALLESL